MKSSRQACARSRREAFCLREDELPQYALCSREPQRTAPGNPGEARTKRYTGAGANGDAERYGSAIRNAECAAFRRTEPAAISQLQLARQNARWPITFPGGL